MEKFQEVATETRDVRDANDSLSTLDDLQLSLIGGGAGDTIWPT